MNFTSLRVGPTMSIPDTYFSNSTMETKLVSFSEEVTTFLTFKIASFIALYWLPVLIPIGIVGNTLSFLVMVKPNNRKMSTCIYMAAISVNDNFMMFLALYKLIIDLTSRIMYLVECIIFAYFVLLTLQNTTYQVLAMTIDKYIAIKWPHKAAIYSTPRRAKITVIGVYFCVLFFNSPLLILSGMVGSECLEYVKEGVFTKVYSWLNFVLNGVIPFTFLIYMNYVIISRVRKSQKMFKNNDINGGIPDQQKGRGDNVWKEKRQKTMKNVENQLTIMLLLVTTLFLVLMIPTYIRFVYSTFIKSDTPQKYARLVLFFHITHKLYNTNNAINFFLYCISGQKFRNDLKEIFCSSRRSSSKSTSCRSVSSNTEICVFPPAYDKRK